MGRRKITTTIYITAEQNDRLRDLHGRTKVPIAEYIRQGIDLILEKNGGVLPAQLSFFADSIPSNGKRPS